MSNYYIDRSPDYLEHHGILGQKWGIRRYQNPDGSLTEEGRKRYGDILTPDQMKNMVKSYNLRTGKNKKINKKTTFKTSHGTYDYKGRRIDTDTEVDDPGKEAERKTDIRKKPSDMTDEELKAATARMRAEREYKEEYAKNHPEPEKKQTAAQQFVENMRNQVVSQIPAGIGRGINKYLETAIGNMANAQTPNQQNQPKPQTTQQSKPQAQTQQPKPQTTQQPKEPTKPAEAPKPKEEKPKEESPRYNSSNSNAMGQFGRRLASDIPDVTSNTTSLFGAGRSNDTSAAAARLVTTIKDKNVDTIKYPSDSELEWYWKQFDD